MNINTFIVSEAVPHVYITNWESSNNPEVLLKYDINAVLTAETHPKNSEDIQLYTTLGIDHLQIFINDDPSENIRRYFDETYNFIQQHVSKRENVLVHCRAGISRSVSFVINWMIMNWYNECLNINPKDAVDNALKIIRVNRPFARPNPGFDQQLYEAAIQYNKSCQQQLSKINTYNNHNMAAPSGPNDKNLAGNAPSSGANIIYLTNDDFDAQGNLTNFSGVNGVIWFFSHGCGHCMHMKGEYEKFAQLLSNSPNIRAFAVDTAKHRDLMMRVKPEIFGYMIRGVPTIVGYAGGKFFSEYEDDDRSKFRTAESLLQYAMGLGSAQIETRST